MNLPELDARSRALASAARPSSVMRASKLRRFSWGDYGRYVLGGVTALALIAAAITIIPRFTTGSPTVETFVNRTPALIATSAPPLEVLRAAIEGVRMAPGAESDALLEDARQLVRDAVNAKLSDANWSRQQLQEASSLALESSTLDPYPGAQELKRLVDEEANAYGITLVSVNPTGNTLTFRAPRGTDQTVTASDGPILDRFRIVRIADTSVRLRDQERGGRELLWPVGGPPNSR